MDIYLMDIENIRPIVTSMRKKTFRPLYSMLCGIESEFALCKLKKKKEDTIFKHIASYYLTLDTSAKTLHGEFAHDLEMTELHSFLTFNESDDESVKKLLSSIRWTCADKKNTFSIGDFSFTSDRLFLDLKEYNGKYYCLQRKSTQCEHDLFEAIELKDIPPQLRYVANDNIRGILASEELNFERYKYTDSPKITDKDFFEVTSKLKETDDEQKAAIRAGTNKNLLIIAGAGSGKTRSLVGRLTYLHLVHGVPLGKILLLTFTRAATQEMAASSNEQIKEAYLSCGAISVKTPHVLSNTIDGFFKQLIERYYLDIGLTQKPNFIFDNAYRRDRLQMLADVIHENHLDNVFAAQLKDEKSLGTLYNALSNCANGITVNISGLENLLGLFVEKQIKENKIVDFVYNAYILKQALEKRECLLHSRISDMYDCILIDEFQDINKLQNDVLSKFYDTSIHFTFVGDDDQTIYTWRGADSNIIKAMASDKKLNTVYLTTNYRNNPYIVNAGNDILETLAERAKTGRAIKAAKKSGTKVRIVRYDDKYENLAHEIKKVCHTRLPGEKICVLFRQVNDQITYVDGRPQRVEGEGKKLARMLQIEHIPTVFENDEGTEYSEGYKLFKALVFILNKINVRNNCAYIKELLHIQSVSNVNIRRLVYGDISASKITPNASATPHSSLYNPTHIAKLAENLNHKFAYAKTVFELISNYNRVFAEVCENQHNADRSVKDATLNAFQKLSDNYNWSYPMKQEALIELFSFFEETVSKKRTKMMNATESSEAIIISSIHKAKGLQYDTVFIVGLNDGEYPNNAQIKAEYDRRVGEFQKLKRSQFNLGQLRTRINKLTIDELKKKCKELSRDNAYGKIFNEDMGCLCEEIDAYEEDYARLTEEGVNAFIDAYHTYMKGHVQAYRDMVARKAKEIFTLREAADSVEEQYHGTDEETPEAQEVYMRWQLLEKKIQIKQDSQNTYQNKLDEFINNIADILAFYDVCNEAKGYLADVRKLRDQGSMIQKLEKEKQAKEQEEQRLFYVAVSRASEKLYLCARENAAISPFVKLIKPTNCEIYEMRTQSQEDAIKVLENNIHTVREEISQIKINGKKVDKGIERILNYSEAFKGEMQEYIKNYIKDHPEYGGLSGNAKMYFDNAIGLLALSEKLGYNFKTEIVHNLQRFMQLFIQDKIGKKAKPYKCDSHTAKKISEDIRKITKAKCRTDIPGEGYLFDLLTVESRYNDELERCKSLLIQCYIVCSGKYIIPEIISDTWKFNKFVCSNSENFLIHALDLVNIRNVMIHEGNQVWETDYLPYAFDCSNTVMKYFVNNISQYQ